MALVITGFGNEGLETAGPNGRADKLFPFSGDHIKVTTEL